MLFLSVLNISTGSFIFLLEDYFTTGPYQSQPRKEGKLVALLSHCFCRKLALKSVSSADCVYMQAGSLESSQCCSCTTVVFASITASCAGPPLPPQAGQARVVLKWESTSYLLLYTHAKTGHVWHSHSEMTRLGKKNPSTTTLKLTLRRLFFTLTKYFAALAIIIAHIQM